MVARVSVVCVAFAACSARLLMLCSAFVTLPSVVSSIDRRLCARLALVEYCAVWSSVACSDSTWLAPTGSCAGWLNLSPVVICCCRFARFVSCWFCDSMKSCAM